MWWSPLLHATCLGLSSAHKPLQQEILRSAGASARRRRPSVAITTSRIASTTSPPPFPPPAAPFNVGSGIHDQAVGNVSRRQSHGLTCSSLSSNFHTVLCLKAPVTVSGEGMWG
ncbi:hypothetical protein CVT26_002501 [Gymnopilus dilepis]|uniref:Uncharacterized protein n=1 Tax=Gymnopilus dilepis TaxID=231916 RepID=A0A409YNI4_9AGAR|nr:hypothetical protein CVT26_002501 [Gymnopilus dilepis]